MSQFIVLEGIDGAGTTTQLAHLSGYLEGLGVHNHTTREPTTGPIGRIIRETLQAKEGAPTRATLPWLFAADRADHLHREIFPALANGIWVLSDRYFHSSLAYQSLDLPLEDVLALNGQFPAPDLTIFLDLDPDTALARINARQGTREIYEHKDLLERIAHQYTVVNRRLQERGDHIVILDGAQPIASVSAAIEETVAPLLSS